MSLKTEIGELLQDLLDDDLNNPMGIRREFKQLFQDVFNDELFSEEIAQTLTYHSSAAASAESYNAETGEYV